MRIGWAFALAVVLSAAAAQDEAMTERLIARKLEALTTGSIDWRVAAARGLARLGPAAAPAAPHLAAALDTSFPELRAAAKDACIAVGPACATHVAKLLVTTRAHTKVAAAEVLARLGGADLVAPTVPQLAEFLESGDAGVRDGALAALTAYADGVDSIAEHVDVLFPHIKHEEPAVCRAIGHILGKARKRDIGRLVRAAVTRRPEVRDAAATALAGLGQAVVPALRKAYESKSPRRRQAVAAVAGRIGSDAAELEPLLIELVRDGKDYVRASAAEALGRVGANPVRVVPVLVAGLDDEAMADACADSLGRLGEPALPALLKLATTRHRERVLHALATSTAPLDAGLTSPDARVRLLCVRALERRGTPEPAAPLVADKNVAVRRAAARATAGTGNDAALPVLVEALGSDERAARIEAAIALGRLARGGRDALRKAARGTDPELAAEAAFALWRLGEDAAPVLARMRETIRLHAYPGVTRRVAAMGQLAEPAVPDLIAALESSLPPVRRAVVEALDILLGARGSDLHVQRRGYVYAPKEIRTAIERALRWLAVHQDTKASGVNGGDGKWDADGFTAHGEEQDGKGDPNCDVGVTGLALLAFLWAGHTPDTGPYAGNVREGLDFLVSRQRADGLIAGGDRLTAHTQHGIATWALADACRAVPRYRAATQRGLDYIDRARNPQMAWRYEPGDTTNCTQVTAWMVGSLRTGAWAGLDVDMNAFRGARCWIEKMTDGHYGKVGYMHPGGPSSRLVGTHERFPPERTEAMTAAGIWCRIVMGEDHRSSEAIKKGAALCLELSPVWDHETGRIDMYFWFFGSLALAGTGGSHERKWRMDLSRTLPAHQHPTGSWDPIGVWGDAGGRVYSTAICAASLLAPGAHERLPGARSWPPPPYDQARAALQKACEDPDAGVAAAAKDAVARIRPNRTRGP